MRQDKIYKVGEAAKMIGVTVSTMQRWDRTGKLVAHRSKSNRRYYTASQIKETVTQRNEVPLDSRVVKRYQGYGVNLAGKKNVKLTALMERPLEDNDPDTENLVLDLDLSQKEKSRLLKDAKHARLDLASYIKWILFGRLSVNLNLSTKEKDELLKAANDSKMDPSAYVKWFLFDNEDKK